MNRQPPFLQGNPFFDQHMDPRSPFFSEKYPHPQDPRGSAFTRPNWSDEDIPSSGRYSIF